MTPEFDLFCKEYLIITLCILLHSLHLLQSLDIGCFVVLKQSYRRQIEGYIYNRVNHIDKEDFLTVYYTTHIESMSLANIQSSFTAIGLTLYDPERVLSKLYTQFKILTPPSSSHITTPQSGPWTIKTPHNPTQLDYQAKAIKTAYLTTPTNRALDQLVKGC